MEAAAQRHTGQAIYFQVPLSLREEALNIPPVPAGGRLRSWQLRRVGPRDRGASPPTWAQPQGLATCELYLQESTCPLYLTGSRAWARMAAKATNVLCQDPLSNVCWCHKAPVVSPGIRVRGRPCNHVSHSNDISHVRHLVVYRLLFINGVELSLEAKSKGRSQKEVEGGT